MHSFFEISNNKSLNARTYFDDVIKQLTNLDYDPKIVSFLLYDRNKQENIIHAVKSKWKELDSITGHDMAIFTYDGSYAYMRNKDKKAAQDLIDKSFDQLSKYLQKHYGQENTFSKIYDKYNINQKYIENAKYPFFLFFILDTEGKHKGIKDIVYYRFTPSNDIRELEDELLDIINTSLDLISGKNQELALKSLKNIDKYRNDGDPIQFMLNKCNIKSENSRFGALEYMMGPVIKILTSIVPNDAQ